MKRKFFRHGFNRRAVIHAVRKIRERNVIDAAIDEAEGLLNHAERSYARIENFARQRRFERDSDRELQAQARDGLDKAYTPTGDAEFEDWLNSYYGEDNAEADEARGS